MKVQEREFFSLAAPEIASAVNAADRRKLIAAVESGRSRTSGSGTSRRPANRRAHRSPMSERDEANFPLTGRGDVNTYMLFAELAAPDRLANGRVGLLVPSGIATDNTTKAVLHAT